MIYLWFPCDLPRIFAFLSTGVVSDPRDPSQVPRMHRWSTTSRICSMAMMPPPRRSQPQIESRLSQGDWAKVDRNIWKSMEKWNSIQKLRGEWFFIFFRGCEKGILWNIYRKAAKVDEQKQWLQVMCPLNKAILRTRLVFGWSLSCCFWHVLDVQLFYFWIELEV